MIFKRSKELIENSLYPTGKIGQPGDIFDVNYQEISDYRDLLKNPSEARNKNLNVKIHYITPQQYFEECAKIFGTSVEYQIRQVEDDEKILNNLHQVIKNDTQFPITFIDYAHRTQEGRHRMYIAGELYGWDKKFPVLVIDWLDKEKASQDLQAQHETDVLKHIQADVNNLKKWEFTDLEEFESELVDFIMPRWSDYYSYESHLEEHPDKYILTVEGIIIEFPKSSIKIKTPDITDDDFDIEDLTENFSEDTLLIL